MLLMRHFLLLFAWQLLGDAQCPTSTMDLLATRSCIEVQCVSYNGPTFSGAMGILGASLTFSTVPVLIRLGVWRAD
jgi:hypothetical protein